MNSCTRSRRWSITFVSIFAVSICGCETMPDGSPNPNAAPDKNTMTANSHPDDPMLASINGPAGEAFIFGKKNASGIPEQVESIVLTDAASGVTYMAQFDDLDRPTFAADDVGNSVFFTYSDTHIGIEFKPAGAEDPVNLSIPNTEVADWPPTFDGKPRLAGKTRHDTAMPSTRGQGFIVTTNVYLTYQGQRVGEQARSTVRGLIDYGLNFKRRYYDGDDVLDAGIYLFEHWHQFEPEDFDRAACEEWASLSNTAGRILTHAGTGIGGLAVLCLAGSALVGGATSPLCVFLGEFAGALLAFGVGAGSSAATEIPNLFLDCENELVVPADPPLAHIRVFVDPNISDVAAKEQVQSVDFRSIRGQTSIEFDFEFEVEPQVLVILVDPFPPTAFSSYRILFAITPPGAAVEWSLVGSDGYTTGGLAQAGPGESSVYSTSIPGGAEMVRDSITATVVIDGQKVGTTETTRFEFQ